MKYEKIVTFFSVTLPVCVTVYLLQLIYTIDSTTGFYKQELSSIGLILFFIIVFASLFVTLSASALKLKPANLPEQNIYMSISAIAMSISLFCEIATDNFNVGARPLQINLLKIFGILTAIYFILFALKLVLYINLPKITAVIPAIYYLVRMICFFTSISSLVIISDNLMLIVAYSAILVFMLNFAKIYNYIECDKSPKALLISGLVAVIFSLSTSIPHIILRVFSGNSHSTLSLAKDVSVLFTGLFVAVYTFSYFYKPKKNRFSKNRFSFKKIIFK